MKEIRLKVECPSCNGTGIYSGMGEKDGAGVVCYKCNGTGCYDYYYKYNEFTRIKKRTDIKRVYLSGMGYCITTKDINLTNGTFVEFSKEGVSYDEFISGKMPKHIESLGCPMSADQGACHKIDGFTDECNRINGGWVSYIPGCKCKNKKKCWDRFNSWKDK